MNQRVDWNEKKKFPVNLVLPVPEKHSKKEKREKPAKHFRKLSQPEKIAYCNRIDKKEEKKADRFQRREILLLSNPEKSEKREKIDGD
jgi:hypothetical protein